VRSPNPLSRPAAVWNAVAWLVALSTVRFALVSGVDVQARLVQLADERYEHARQERRLFWRMVAISALVAIVVTARMLAA
jgi:phosphatidylglycerophosphate synthase